jgi:hypothetical protein
MTISHDSDLGFNHTLASGAVFSIAHDSDLALDHVSASGAVFSIAHDSDLAFDHVSASGAVLSVSHTQGLYVPIAVTAALTLDYSVGYTDYTTAANESTPNDVIALPASIAAGDGFIVMSGDKFARILIDVTTAGTGTYTITHSYWNGSAWTALSTYTDGLRYSAQCSNFKSTGLGSLNFVSPSNWAASTISGYYGYAFMFRYAAGAVTIQPRLGQVWVSKNISTMALPIFANRGIHEPTMKIFN